jgi:hypothetical protein
MSLVKATIAGGLLASGAAVLGAASTPAGAATVNPAPVSQLVSLIESFPGGSNVGLFDGNPVGYLEGFSAAAACDVINVLNAQAVPC